MKTKSFFLVVAASLLGWSLGNASVTGVTDWGLAEAFIAILLYGTVPAALG